MGIYIKYLTNKSDINIIREYKMFRIGISMNIIFKLIVGVSIFNFIETFISF